MQIDIFLRLFTSSTLVRFCFAVPFFVAATWAAADYPVGSYQKMDYGPVIGETVQADWPENNTAFKGLAVRLDRNATMVFDTDLMRWSVAASGGWVDLSRTSHTSYKGSRPAGVEGREIFATTTGPGWARDGSFDDPREGRRGSLPREWARWNGFFRHGDRIALSYTVGDTGVMESPFAVEVEGEVVFGRQIRSGGSGETMTAYVASARPEAKLEFRHGALLAREEERTVVFRVDSDLEGVGLRLGKNGRVELVWPPHDGPAEARLMVWEERGDVVLAPAAVREVVRAKAMDLAAARRGGPARWEKEIETAVELAEADAAYVTDRIGLPFDNPWGSWIRPTGFDFFAGGDRAAVSTWNGDVWIVSGLGNNMNRLKWRRFASGLYYPMGVVVLDGTIHVIERGQLTRLHDLNGNGEADFYESLNNDGVLHPMAHTLCLEVDSAGNFYFYKNGNRAPGSAPGHGALVRVSADGATREIVASGIRGSNTLAIGPGDTILGADQQGNWVPTARVDWLREGGYYGYPSHNPDRRAEGDFDAPVCWIPHLVDNSSGAMVYLGDERWGPMHGNWAIGSYGQATLLALLVEKKGEQMQGGVVQFPLEFGSGLVRARMSPGDGQLYLLGMKGWQTTGPEDGSFDRVRYTGLPNRMPAGLSVEPGGVRIEFSDALDPGSIIAENFEVERWQYRYWRSYGSPEMSVANPDERGRDPVAVASASLSEDRKSVFVEIPELKPVMQQGISYRVRFADGGLAENTIYHTIHRLSDDDETVAMASSSVLGSEVDEQTSQEAGGDDADLAAFAPGREIFESTCSACHQPAGQGGVAPSLAESSWAGGDAGALIRIVLQGKLGEQGAMMPFSWMSDDEIAALLSYIRVRWHNEEPISGEKVRAVRAATAGRSDLWTTEELRGLE